MNIATEKYLVKLCEREKWDTFVKDGELYVHAHDHQFKLSHPYRIYLGLYRTAMDSGLKLEFMHRLNDIFWPEHALTWNYWTERRFAAHCEGFEIISFAGGAAIGKSVDAAKIGVIKWLSNPRKSAVTVASVTLESLEKRIWGYVVTLIQDIKQQFPRLPATIFRGKPPKILHPMQEDKIHGLFAAAVRMGDKEQAIATIIGQHPKEELMLFLDEGTDMNSGIMEAVTNLKKGVDFFQMFVIGNSKSKNDLHGSVSTPKNGWDSINPRRDYIWPTQQNNGVCLYFSPYDSPAIHEKDPVKKAALSKFLITAEQLAADKEMYGEDSETFARFVLGFWRLSQVDNTIVSEPFLQENQVFNKAEWSGFYPLKIVAGLDPAYQTGGTGCVLRLAIYGQRMDGQVCLDYHGEKLLFRIDISARSKDSADLQIAREIKKILDQYQCPLSLLAIDCTGVGRALGEVIKLYMREEREPIKLVSVRPKKMDSTSDLDATIKTVAPVDMWSLFRRFVQNNNVRGIDKLSGEQLVNRLVTLKNGKLVLESKADYIARMAAINPKLATSPDEADAMILAMMAAHLGLGYQPGDRRDLPSIAHSQLHLEKATAFARIQQQQRQTQEQHRSRPPLIPNFSTSVEDIPE